MSTAGMFASRRWIEQAVTFDGDFDRVTRRRAGTAPRVAADAGVDRRAVAAGLPAHRPARRRLVPQVAPGPDLAEALALVAEGAAEAGRDPADLGMKGRVTWRGDADQLVERVQRWRNAGASHVAINTMRAGLGTVDDHLGRAGGRRRGARAELTTAGA